MELVYLIFMVFMVNVEANKPYMDPMDVVGHLAALNHKQHEVIKFG